MRFPATPPGTLKQVLLLPAIGLFGGCSTHLAPVPKVPAQPPSVEAAVVAAGHPYDAWRWRRLTWLGADGRIAPDAWRHAHDQWLANALRTQAENANSIEWIERGPRNVGGRTRSLLIDPRDPARLWAGSVSGGIFHSTDRGLHWTPSDDWLPSLAIGCMAMAPDNPDLLYAGTGEGFFNYDAIGGAGLLRSTDGGGHWEQMPATAEWGNVCRIAISRQDPRRILAAVRYGGIYRSSDAGDTWENVRPAQGSFYVAFDPTDDQKAVAHILDYTSNWVHRALYTTDGGSTWEIAAGLDELVGFDPRIELAYAPSDPDLVYASVAIDGGVIWRSEDGGHSYSRRTLSDQSAVSWYANPLWVDPTDPDFLLTGGLNVLKSTDGGVTLTQISSGYIGGEQPHVDLHAFVAEPGFDGGENTTVYVCNDGGVWRAERIYEASTSSGWSRCDQDYVAMQLYGAAGDGPDDLIVGGTQDNGTQRLIGDDPVAHLTYGGDGGFCAIDPTDPHQLYGEYIVLQIFRSRNRGYSAAGITANLPDAGSRANFIAPFILDPNNPRVMLAGGYSLWRSPDVQAVGQPQWEEIRPGLVTNHSAIAVASGNSDIIWVGLNDGEVFRTENGTAAEPDWRIVDNNMFKNPLPNRYVTRIMIDPWDPQRVYVALGGFEPNGLWRTDDGGFNWRPICGTEPTALPDAPVRGIARHPADPDWLFAGTEMGLFSSTDGGTTWSASTFGPAAVSVDEVVFMNNSETLLAATHGRGIFTADLNTHVLQLDAWGIRPGGSPTVRVRGAEPGSRVNLAYSRSGEGRTYVPVMGATLDLDDAQFLRAGIADDQGEVVFHFDREERSFVEHSFRIQAIAPRAVSNVVPAAG